MQATAADTAVLPAVPEGLHRIVQMATGYSDAQITQVSIDIVRNGVIFPIAMDGSGVVAISERISAVCAKGFMLRPGDILRANDIQVAGADVYISIMYVDVYL